METAERLSILARHAAALVEEGMTVGLGSGSTAEAVIRTLGERVAAGLRVTGVPTSANTAALATRLGIHLIELDAVDRIDLGIDGADEIDPALNLVKGRGGALLWEKLVAQSCERWIVVAASEKLVERLGTRMPLPVEIVPYGARRTVARIEALAGGRAPIRRNADGAPFVTDGGHLIVDLATGPILDAPSLAYALKAITGVVDHGLFVGFADAALTVDEQGAVTELYRSAAS